MSHQILNILVLAKHGRDLFHKLSKIWKHQGEREEREVTCPWVAKWFAVHCNSVLGF